MKIKEQTRKIAAGCSKHCFEVVDRTDEVSNHTYGKAKLTWFEEIFEEYENKNTTLCKDTRCGCILSLRPSSLHKEKEDWVNLQTACNHCKGEENF